MKSLTVICGTSSTKHACYEIVYVT